MSAEKTEKPTGKRLKEAAKKGQVVRSRDLAVAGATVAAIIALGQAGGRLVDGLGDRLARDLNHFGDTPLRTVTAGDLNNLAISSILTMLWLVGPIALATVVAGVGLQGMQGGWVMATESIGFNFDRLNPANGIKRFSPMQGGVDTLKSLAAVAVIAWLTWTAVNALMTESLGMPWMTPLGAAALGWERTISFMWKIAWGLMALAAADYGLQYYRLMQSLKMSKQEIKDEARQMDGSAEVKGRIRAIQRDMMRRRMINDVKRATVVITNPTHFAVALEYRRGEMTAPVVLAKGADHIAAAIREQAREHGVPMIENKPLAQTLFKTAEVGQQIPAELFAAVAEVLAQMIRLKQLTL
jgi:flagellar biosynthetic protein FlhB